MFPQGCCGLQSNNKVLNIGELKATNLGWSISDSILWDIEVKTADLFEPALIPGDQVISIMTHQDRGLFDEDYAQVEECTIIVLGFCEFDLVSMGQTENPGTWSVVPIPGAAWLFGSGLVGLIGVARRKKS